jgi:beta-mannosidase
MRKLSLGGNWRVSSLDKKYQWDEFPVPGTILQQVEKTGYYGKEDVFYRENNRKCVEIVSRGFKFLKDFELPLEFLGADRRVYLECLGLDTLCSLSLNGKKLGEANNMHRSWSFRLDELIGQNLGVNNQLLIEFDDAVKAARDNQKRRPLWQVVSPLPGAMHVRKNFCSFGWDWGPQMPDVGIFRDIQITSYLGARFEDFHVQQIHNQRGVFLQISSRIDSWTEKPVLIELSIKTPDGDISHHKMYPEKTLEIKIENPLLWWPNGLGEHPLYEIKALLIVNGETADSRQLRIGLRTIRLERKKDAFGECFQFNINGIAIFAKGSNYIPEDVYLTRVTREKTFQLISSAKAANFNCMRVWGGGIYPDQAFYDACDEMGIIIWQDLMFSCAIYDIHNVDFYENIRKEVTENLERIRHHASLGLICGNNEMEWGFEAWGFPHTKEHRVEYIKQYEILFPQIVNEVCSYIDYWPASPSSGGYFEEPNHPDKGDVHYWDVWHGRKNYTEFRKHYFRFLSEFGFQSFPNIKTVKSYTAPTDRNIFSPVMEDHQRNDSENGNAKILHFIADYYRYPKDFGSVIYVSQMSQAEALRYAVEHLRQNRGRCMGATYWQFNDNWPVASWSSVDYYGRWKAMHYMAKRVFDNYLLSIREEGHKAQIHLSNESHKSLVGRLLWELKDFGGHIFSKGESAVEIPAFNSHNVFDLDFSTFLQGHHRRERYLSATFLGDNSHLRSTSSFVPYKHLELVNPNLSFELLKDVKRDGVSLKNDVIGSFAIKIHSKKFAKFIEIDSEFFDFILSDNYFDLDAGESKIVFIENIKSLDGRSHSVEEIEKSMNVRSLIDTFV